MMRALGVIACTWCACGGSTSPGSGDGPMGDGASNSTALWTAPDIGSIDAFAMDASNLYFTHRYGNQDTIYALAKSGGAPTTVHELPPGISNGLAVDASHIYFTEGAVYSMPLTGGTPTAVTTITSTGGPLSVDAQYVYFIDGSDGRLSRAPIGGGAATDVAMSVTTHYWLGDTSATVATTNTIEQQPLGGTQPLQLDAFPSGATPVGVYTDGTTAFAAIQDQTSSTFSGYIDAVPVTGGGGTTIYVAPVDTLGQDARPQISAPIGYGSDLYLFANYTGVNDVSADLVAVPKVKGGAPVTLVAQQSSPYFVAGVDAEFVYYVDRKGPNGVQEIRRAPHP